MKSSFIVKDYCIDADSREDVLKHSMIPEIGAKYMVQSIDMTRSAANPDLFFVTVQLKQASDDETESK